MVLASGVQFASVPAGRFETANRAQSVSLIQSVDLRFAQDYSEMTDLPHKFVNHLAQRVFVRVRRNLAQ